MDWDIEIGTTLRRTEVHRRLGGQAQQGISTPANSPNILIFSDPLAGKQFGYDVHEGQQPDGSYRFTGEGQVGPMEFVRGNAAIRDAATNNKAIRLFLTTGVQATYVGAFTLDRPGWRTEQIPDRNGDLRDGIIFNLIPVDADLDLVPVRAGEEDVSHGSWFPRDSTSYPVAERVQKSLATREEFLLEAKLGRWLEGQKHEIESLTIVSNGRALHPDLFDVTSGELIEVKKSSTSTYVREAIGQVLDYQHCARSKGIEATAAIAVPKKPNTDLVALCKRLSIAIYVPAGSSFTKLT